MKIRGWISLLSVLLFVVGLGCFKGDGIGSSGALKGFVVQADGATPVAGAKVSFISGNDISYVNTDAQGFFSVKLSAGKIYSVFAESAGMKSSVVVSPRLIANKVLDLGRLALKGVGGIVGRVTDSNGAVVSGATVQIKDASGNIIIEVQTDSSGQVNITNIPEGSYTITIRSGDGTLSINLPNIVVTAGTTVDLGTVVIVPQSATKIKAMGSILDSATQVISGVKVEFKNSSSFDVLGTVMSGAGGSFVAEVIPGTYMVIYSKSGYYTLNLFGQELKKDTTLPTVVLVSTSVPTGGIKGQIKANGVTQDGVIITVLNADGNVVASGVTPLLGNGIFNISTIPAGTYTVRFESSAIDRLERQVTVVAGQITNMGVVETQATSGLKGVIVDQNGQPVANATVILKDKNGNVIATVTTNLDGSFLFKNINPASNNYLIEVTKDGYDAIVFNNGGSFYSVSLGTYTEIKGDNIVFYKSIGNIEITVKDGITSSAVSGIAVVLDNETKTSGSNGKVTFSNRVSHKSYSAVSAETSIYQSVTLNTGELQTNQTLAKDLILIRKTATVTGTDIKLSDTGSNIQSGTVTICNDSLLPLVNGVHCIVVPISNGGVTLPNLPFGSGYEITVHYSDDYQNITGTSITLDSQNENLSDLIGNLVLNPGSNAKAGIKVVVNGGDTGQPLSQVSVKIGSTVYKTNDSGIVETGNNLALGSYAVLINEGSATNWKYASKTLTVSAAQVNQIVNQTVSLDRKTASVTISVKRNDNNAAISGASINLGILSAIADANGMAIFSNVKYDDYAIQAALGGYITGNVSTRVNGSQSIVLKLMVDTGVSFKITASGVQNGDFLTVLSGGSIVKSLSATSDNFAITGLAAGTYTVKADRTFYQTAESGAVTLGPDGNVSFSFNASGDGTSAGSRKKGSLTGKIVLNAPAGETITAVQVALTGDGSYSVNPDSQGNFSFANIYQGNYTITATYANYGTVTKNIAVGGAQDAGMITMDPNYASVKFQIAGNGGSASGAAIVFDGVSKTLDSNGEYIFTGVKRGTYTYSVSKADYVGINSASFTVNAGETKVVSNAISAYGTIRGYVKNSVTSFPAATVSITGVQNANPQLDSNAYFSVKVPAGQYTINIANLGYGYDNLQDIFTLPAGGVYDLQANWNPSDDGSGTGSGDIGSGDTLKQYTLVVNVKGNGSNLANVKVSTGSLQAVTDSNGNVTFTVQKGQTYSVTLTNLPVGYVSQTQSKTISVKAETLSFSLTPAQITLAANASATFKIYDNASQLVDTKTAGTYLIQPGQYKVEASSDGYITQTSGFQTAGQITFNFTLQRYASVTGRIISNGVGVSGAQIAFAGGASLLSDSSGYFNGTMLPGLYNYTVTKTGYQTVTGTKSLSEGGNNLGDIAIAGQGGIVGKVMTLAYCDTNGNKKLISCNVPGATFHDSVAVTGAYLRLYVDGSNDSIGSSISGSDGTFRMSAAAGYNLSVRADKDGYFTGSKSGIRVETGSDTNIGTVYLPDASLLPPDGSWSNGSVQGDIVNAITGKKINDRSITVEVHTGGANGPIVNKTNGQQAVGTTSTGSFKIGDASAGLVPGQYYTVVLKDASGYYTQAVYDMVIVDGVTDIGVIAMTPQLPDGQIRFTLRWVSDEYDYVNNTVKSSASCSGWGCPTNDLDGHLVGDSIHVWYGNRTGHSPMAEQDIDDTVWCTKNGETITMNSSAPNGTYSYTVHNYNKATSSTSLFTNSHAIVMIYDSFGVKSIIKIDEPLRNNVASNGWKVAEIDKTGSSYYIRVFNQTRNISSWSGTGSGVRSAGMSYEESVISKDVAAKPKVQ